MKRLWTLVLVALAFFLLVALGPWSSDGHSAQAARRYEAVTIRAVVNSEFVKYSLSLIDKELYDKLAEMKTRGIEYRPDWAAKAK